MVPFDNHQDAHYLCAVLNASPVRLAVQSYIVLHPDSHVLKNINIPIFSKATRGHLKLVELSEAAHRAAEAGDTAEVKQIEEEVDHWAAKLWELSDEELAEIRSSLEESD